MDSSGAIVAGSFLVSMGSVNAGGSFMATVEANLPTGSYTVQSFVVLNDMVSVSAVETASFTVS